MGCQGGVREVSVKGQETSIGVAWGSLGGNLRSLGGHTCRQVSPLWLQYRMKADKAKMLEKPMKNNDF